MYSIFVKLAGGGLAGGPGRGDGHVYRSIMCNYLLTLFHENMPNAEISMLAVFAFFYLQYWMVA